MALATPLDSIAVRCEVCVGPCPFRFIVFLVFFPGDWLLGSVGCCRSIGTFGLCDVHGQLLSVNLNNVRMLLYI